MAVYKVPQDVEADDKLIGPFSFRQFVFLLLFAGSLYMAYLFFSVTPVLGVLPLPFTIIFAALAFPWRKDQPTEVYLTALIHFWLKPRRRIWNQAGQLEHIKISAPVINTHQFTDGMSNIQVRSRLKNLATTLDTHGWDSRNVASAAAAGQVTQTYAPAYQNVAQTTDRLVAQPLAPQQVQDHAFDVTAANDVLDVNNNPVAQNFEGLVNKAEADRKAQLIQQMQQAAAAPQTQTATQPVASVPAAQPDPSPQIQPYPANMQQVVVTPNPATTDPTQPTQSTTTTQTQKTEAESLGTQPDPSILNLANNSDLNVSTIARQAEQAMNSGDTIELH